MAWAIVTAFFEIWGIIIGGMIALMIVSVLFSAVAAPFALAADWAAGGGPLPTYKPEPERMDGDYGQHWWRDSAGNWWPEKRPWFYSSEDQFWPVFEQGEWVWPEALFYYIKDQHGYCKHLNTERSV